MSFHRIMISAAVIFFPLRQAFAAQIPTPWDAPRFHDKGPLQYSASLESLYQWDSNVRHQAADGKSDHIAVVRPVLAARVTGPEDSYVSALYQLEGERFADTIELNTLNHLADVRAKLGARHGYLTASELYLRTNDRTNTVFADRVRREENTVRAGVGAILLDWKPEFNGEFFKRLYSDPTLPGYTAYALEPRLIWEKDERNRGTLSARWEHLLYPETTARDGNVYEGRAAWAYASVGSGVWLNANAGIQRRIYRGPGVTGYFGPIGEGNARYVPRDRIALTAGYSCSLQEAPLEPPSAYYRQHALNAGVEYKTGDRLSSRLSQSLISQLYGDNTRQPDFSGQRRDTTVSTAFTETYRLNEHASLSGNFSWEERRSNASSQGYHGFIFSFGCKFEI